MGTAFFSNKKQSFNAALRKTIFTQKGHSAYEAAISGALQEHTIIRMDLVHDEFFWYANFLIRIAANT